LDGVTGLRTERSLVLSVSEHKTPTDLRRAGVNQCALTEALTSISPILDVLFCGAIILCILYVLLSVLNLYSHFGLLL